MLYSLSYTNPMESIIPQRHHLTRDQIIQIQTLYAAGFNYEAIAKQLSITVRQARYNCLRSYPTPIKRRGRTPKLSADQSAALIEYVCSSKYTKRLSYLHLSLRFEHWNVGEHTIRSTL